MKNDLAIISRSHLYYDILYMFTLFLLKKYIKHFTYHLCCKFELPSL